MSDKPIQQEDTVVSSVDETTLIAEVGPLSGLRCQWCAVSLPKGVTACPTCGSQGVPDSEAAVPDPQSAPGPEPVPSERVLFTDADPFVAILDDQAASDDEFLPRRRLPSFEETEQRRMQTIYVIAGAVIFCAFVGWLLSPALLDGPVESLTGTPIEDPGDLRGMGAFIGLLVGLLFGATGGFIIWADR